MDRNTVIGFILIGLVLMVWMYVNAPPPAPPRTGQDTTGAVSPGGRTGPPRTDTLRQATGGTAGPVHDTGQAPADPDSLGRFFGAAAKGRREVLTVESDLYRAELTNRGGGIALWELKKYRSWDGHPVTYFDRSESAAFNLFFLSSDGKQINTRSLYFTPDRPGGGAVKLAPGDSLAVTYTLRVSDRSSIVRTLHFRGDSYQVGVSYRFVNMESVISNFKYVVAWESGLRFQEGNSVDEASFAKAATYAGGEETEIDATSVGEPVKESLSGKVAWTAVRNKYFVAAIVPAGKESQGAFMEGHRVSAPDEGVIEQYVVGLEMPFLGRPDDTDRFTLYLGPLDYEIVRGLDIELDRIMSLGAVWIIRPISQFFIIPIFHFLHWFIPNYGVILIIFAFIIKVILYPLTKSSMQSMQRMQALQPMVTEIREKHKEDPQEMNRQMMRLYKEYGVNPAGGCLPLLLQLPILYALWSVFSSTIELRQAGFIWWMQDLATPDVIYELPMKIPLFGVDKISGLAVAMGVTMFVQQKMSVKDPRQKMMVWMMPLMMTLLFISFPSGLNLYYFVFNLLSIAQQAYVNKKHAHDPLRKVDPKKGSGGIIAKLSKNLPKAPKR